MDRLETVGELFFDSFHVNCEDRNCDGTCGDDDGFCKCRYDNCPYGGLPVATLQVR